MNNELRSCPLCGGETRENYYNIIGEVFECPECKLVMIKSWFPHNTPQQEMLIKWNTRVGDKK